MTTHSPRRIVRAFGVLTLALPLTASFLLVTAGPAAASSSISAPADGSVYTSGTSTTASADLDPCAGTTTLKVVNPDNSNSWSQTSARPSSCDGLFPPSTRRKFSVKPSWIETAANGQFTVTLSGGATSTKSFYTNLPPTQTPSGLTAQGTGRSQVDLSWTYSGQEQDLWGFRIEDDHSHSVQVSRSDAGCASGSSCSYSNSSWDDNAEPGTYTYSFTVTALRLSGGCSSCGDYTESSKSESATAQLVTPQPPPSPTPTPDPTGSPGTGGTTGGSGGSTTGTPGGGTTGATGGTGGSTTGSSGSGSGGTTGHNGAPLVLPTLPTIVTQRRDFALGFNRFSPSLGIPKLPPLPKTDFPVMASGAGGPYQPVLPYKNEPGKTTSVFSSPIAAVTDLNVAVLAKDIAFSLVLLMIGAHVYAFMVRPEED